MTKTLISLLVAASLPLAACTSTTDDRTLASAGTGAAIGAAGGAGVAAIAGGDILTGAAIGAAVGGLAGAVWSDSNGDGYADGYVQNGTYYAGTPSGYDPTLRRVVTGAAVGGALGAVGGAVIGGLSPIEGAVIGAAVGGLVGAVWADNDRDGRADGYVYNGQYYQGQPSGYAPTSAPPPMAGERG